MKIIIIILLILSLFITTLSFADDGPVIKVLDTNNVSFYYRLVNIKETDTGYIVTGNLYSRLRVGIIKGHIDIKVLSGNKKLILEKTAEFHSKIHSRRLLRMNPLRFSQTLPHIPDDSSVLISFHNQEFHGE